MSNIILSALATIVLTISAVAFGTSEETPKHQLSQDQQIEIYEQVMDDCVIDK